jgi:hypothetical protein
LIIDYNQWEYVDNLDLDLINNMYIGWNFVHLVNAGMYAANWLQVGFPALHVVQIPEL